MKARPGLSQGAAIVAAGVTCRLRVATGASASPLGSEPRLDIPGPQGTPVRLPPSAHHPVATRWGASCFLPGQRWDSSRYLWAMAPG